jgi:hypothetical protein
VSASPCRLGNPVCRKPKLLHAAAFNCKSARPAVIAPLLVPYIHMLAPSILPLIRIAQIHPTCMWWQQFETKQRSPIKQRSWRIVSVSS